MNDKEKVTAEIKQFAEYVRRNSLRTINAGTLDAWACMLEQDEQQTSPSPNGLGCSGESSVQPGAIAICMHAEADLLEVKADGESLSASLSLYGKATAYREIAEKAEREGWTRTR